MPEIQGIVEDIVFHNEENGYIIAHLNDNKEANNCGRNCAIHK